MKKRGNAALNKHLKTGFENHEFREDSTKDAHYLKTFLQEATSGRVIFVFNLNWISAKTAQNTIYINLKMILTLNKDCDAQAYNP